MVNKCHCNSHRYAWRSLLIDVDRYLLHHAIVAAANAARGEGKCCDEVSQDRTIVWSRYVDVLQGDEQGKMSPEISDR